MQRVRPLAWGLLVVTAISAVLGTNIEQSGIYLLFTTCASALFVGFIDVLLRRARLTAIRSIPQTVAVNQTLEYKVKVKNVGARRLRGGQFIELSSKENVSKLEFATIVEPGEENRNVVDRFLLHYRWTWLLEQRRRFKNLFGLPIINLLKPQEETEVIFRWTPRNRGVAKFERLRVALPDTFGLFQRLITVPTRCDEVSILPRVHSIPARQFQLLQGLNEQQGQSFPKIGNSTDFLQIRDYHPGDPLQKIDWKTWARTNQPMVREFEEEASQASALIFDRAGQEDPSFEGAIEIVASLLAPQNLQKSLFDWALLGNTSHELASQPKQSFQKALLQLSRMDPVEEDEEAFKQKSIRKSLQKFSHIIWVGSKINSQKLTALDSLKGPHNSIHILLIQHSLDESSIENKKIHLIRPSSLLVDFKNTLNAITKKSS